MRTSSVVPQVHTGSERELQIEFWHVRSGRTQLLNTVSGHAEGCDAKNVLTIGMLTETPAQRLSGVEVNEGGVAVARIHMHEANLGAHKRGVGKLYRLTNARFRASSKWPPI